MSRETKPRELTHEEKVGVEPKPVYDGIRMVAEEERQTRLKYGHTQPGIGYPNFDADQHLPETPDTLLTDPLLEFIKVDQLFLKMTGCREVLVLLSYAAGPPALRDVLPPDECVQHLGQAWWALDGWRVGYASHRKYLPANYPCKTIEQEECYFPRTKHSISGTIRETVRIHTLQETPQERLSREQAKLRHELDALKANGVHP
jgi:hypothetical protein